MEYLISSTTRAHMRAPIAPKLSVRAVGDDASRTGSGLLFPEPLFHGIEQTALENQVHLPRAEAVSELIGLIGVTITRLYRATLLQRFTQITEDQHMIPLDAVMVLVILEGQRQDPEIDQILPVNPGIALGDDAAHAQIARTQRRVFPAGALPVVAPAHQGRA